MGSRAIYHDGWMASALGPRLPWVAGLPPGIKEWTPDKDVWGSCKLDEDWSQANDLAAKMPEKLAQLKDLFLIEATKNKALPIGGGLWIAILHPELRNHASLYGVDLLRKHRRIPEFCAPALGKEAQCRHHRRRDPAQRQRRALQLGANSGGLYLLRGGRVLCYEYNLFIIQRTKIRAKQKLPVGKVKIEVETVYVVPRPGGPLNITMKVNGEVFANGQVPIARRCSLPPTTVSTSELSTVHQCRLITTTRCRSSSTGLSTRCTWDTSQRRTS